MLAWMGIACLAASWLFGMPYYHRPEWVAWAALTVLGVGLLTAVPARVPSRLRLLAAGVLLLPAVAFAGMPHRTAFAVALAGCGVGLGAWWLPQRWRRFRAAVTRLATAGMLAGGVLACQGLVLWLYQILTSRSHELPLSLPRLVGAVAEFLGVGVGVSESTLALFSMREHHLLGATWELVADPVSLAFVGGGLALLAWRAGVVSGRWAWGGWLRDAGVLLVAVAAWLPLRAGLVIALFLTSVLRTEYEASPNSVHWLWNGWLHLALLALPVLAAWRFLPPRPLSVRSEAGLAAGAPAAGGTRWRSLAAALAAFAGAVLLTLAIAWAPPGTRQRGRVLIEEYHPNPEEVWERCDKPYDTTWYGHMSGYNYYCIKEYLDRFFSVTRLTEPITAAALQHCDVLMLKTPTRPYYSREELSAIREFVEAGGGLLVIGEHTDVFKTSTRLNPVTRMFGFRFRNDCLFGIDSVFEQRFEPPLVPHPVVQGIEWMDFATSCSLDVGWSLGRAPIRSTGLKNKTADYHVSNYYPPPSDNAQMRSGAFVQVWTTRAGRGRVLAFTDSTIFSNFATFEPGKAELMVGMVEWLNHRPPRVAHEVWLALAAALAAGAACWLGRRRGVRLVLLAAVAAGWSGGGMLAGVLQRLAMPMPAPRPDRALVRVVMDRTVSSAHLPRNGFIAGKTDGFGIFERWVLRLGFFTTRRSAPGTFARDVSLLVIANPARPVTSSYRRDIEHFVENGGRVLVLDSARNESSTANELLAGFGVTLTPAPTARGDLQNSAGWAPVPVERVRRVEGGKPFAWLGEPEDGLCVGSVVRHGQGILAVVGFSDRFCDLNMGFTGDVEPEEGLRKVHALEFSLVRALVEGTDLTTPPPPAAPAE